ncbi:MAG: hypothetical protein GC159_14705 [Phycisphaera sp.]|nr:hypothetical protein [Phycisphaera sp.]
MAAQAPSKPAEPELPPKKGKAKPHKMGDLNLTSMMDVVFQLLIFFVLTASFAVGEGILPAELPVGQGKQADTDTPKQPIKVLLKSAGGEDVLIQLEGMPTAPADFPELYQTLRSMQVGSGGAFAVYNKDDPIIIKPDSTVRWGHVVNAFNACVRAKYENINFSEPGN